MNDDVMNQLKKDYLYKLMLENKRADGRNFEEYREIEIQTDIIDKAEGSASIKLGNTYLVAGIKIQPGEPFPDTPDDGVIITNIELLPMASPIFEAGPPREDAVELARVIDRGIRESKAIDLKQLCITPGEKVWIIFIDIHVLNDGGNIMDAASLATTAALLKTKIPEKQYQLGNNNNDDKRLPIRNIPIATTATTLENTIILDPTNDEEQIAGTKLTIITNTNNTISAIQKSGREPLTPTQIQHITTLAKEQSQKLREKFLEV
ncbi:RNA-binding protein [Methanosarcinales archaeon ex4572_44]|nr:MAG: RNA-binding protein [Methanosarcinales archaeon ex4572_44]RLG28292.1 MAG: RNA-binding protein [Methanosarcinales archaeon]RLG93544.1 MAG: RNA-binding protein [Candidatus Bathyarchaeota archaeon]